MSGNQTPTYNDLAKSTAFGYAKKAGWSAQKFIKEFHLAMDKFQNEETVVLENMQKELKGDYGSVLWIVRGRRIVDHPEDVAQEMLKYHVITAILNTRRNFSV